MGEPVRTILEAAYIRRAGIERALIIAKKEVDRLEARRLEIHNEIGKLIGAPKVVIGESGRAVVREGAK